ncbi:MAG: hypothetical protein GX868_04740 [Actinobacteria bacterium]|nr:hypothetical protein [Actinomycetota bacterium]
MAAGLDAAIAWARRTRDERARFVERITTEGLGPAQLSTVLDGTSDAIRTLRLLPCIEAMPVAGGKVRSRRAIAAAGLDGATPLGEISKQEWQALSQQVGDGAQSTSNPPRSKPVIIVVSGPGGVGKGTVVNAWLEKHPTLYVNRSWTTRSPRPGESPSAYVFATPEEFQDHIDADGFLEWVDFLDYRQGSPVPTPPEGHDVLFEIDVQGAQLIKQRFPDALLVYLDAPSREEQQRRLVGRGDTAERVAQRIAHAEREAALAKELGMVEIVNHTVAETVEEIAALVERHRASLD